MTVVIIYQEPSVTQYALGLSMKEALRRYFDDNGFGPDGGYPDVWVDLKLGPIPIPFPNTDARRRAVRFHDLHHIATGYQTDYAGEFEISAWEIATGCRDFIAAWQINLAGLGGGLVVYPKRTLRAFMRGRQTKNFYGEAYEPLLALSVGDARTMLGLEAAVSAATWSDRAAFIFAAIASVMVGLASFAIFVPLGLLAAPFLHLAARRSRATRSGQAVPADTSLG